jgi:centrosomal protein CEP104
MENTQKLKFRLIEATSEDPNNPLFELIRGSESSGWMSSRFCTYPQEIIIQFLSPVNLKQINILSNEKKISSMIEFYSYYPSGNSDYFTNYKLVSYEKLGYIRMDSNSKSKYRAREFRKVFINTNCIYLKLVMNKNYVNKYNVFNQVGLIGLEFMGTPINYKHNELYLKESLKEYDLKEYELDDISQEKLKIMKTQQEEAIKIEDYDEAKRLKKLIDRIKFIGRKIHELEVQKKIFINNEDYDNAKIIKLEIDRLKSNLKNVDKNIAINAQNISVENNKSSEGDEIITENYHKDISVLNDTIQQEKESKEKNDKEK